MVLSTEGVLLSRAYEVENEQLIFDKGKKQNRFIYTKIVKMKENKQETKKWHKKSEYVLITIIIILIFLI